MIIGNGMIAKEFASYLDVEDIIIFASGVSNSNEQRISEFNREKKLLIKSIVANKRFIYMSTTSIYDTYFEHSKYVKHKLEMEKIISTYSNNYIIIRLPQVAGKNNKFQLLGFLNKKIQTNEVFNLYDIERNIIDIMDVKKICDIIIENNLFQNKIINIANTNNIIVMQLVSKMEKILRKKARYNIDNKSGNLFINIENIKYILDDLNINNDTYIDDLLEKYYG